MVDKNNPLDDDLLKELGLEPREEHSSAAEHSLDDESRENDNFIDEAFEEKNPDSSPTSSQKSSEISFDDFSLDENEAAAEAPQPPKQTQQEVFKQPKPDEGDQIEKNLGRLTQDMPIQMVAVLGKKTMLLREVVDLKQGEIIQMNKLPGEAIDLVANGKLIARGVLVMVDGKVGIEIKQIVE